MFNCQNEISGIPILGDYSNLYRRSDWEYFLCDQLSFDTIIQAGAELSVATRVARRSSKVLEKRSLKSLGKVGNLYQASTTLGLEPVSIVHYTRPGSSIKQPTPN